MSLASTYKLASAESDAARDRMVLQEDGPLLLSDWDRALFIHFEIESSELQPHVPFRLDCREGKAYVSLVAFTMLRMRPRLGGRLAECCFLPIATHELLNLRTYVRHRRETGIYFLAEWIPNRLSVFLGPRTFSLPYRLARLNYQHCHEQGTLRGCVEWRALRDTSGNDCLKFEYTANVIEGAREGFHPSSAGSMDTFLLERYIGFTQCGAKSRFFRVWHHPWPQCRVELSMSNDSLLRAVMPVLGAAKLVHANYSPGVRNVWMGRPHRLPNAAGSHSILSAFFEMP